jgi:hypothetical protein
MAKSITVSFSFAVTEPKGSYDSLKVFGTAVQSEVVPEGQNPTAYLRARMIAEFDRLTGLAS